MCSFTHFLHFLLQHHSSPPAVTFWAGALRALPAGLCGGGHLPVRLCSGCMRVQHWRCLDAKHAGTGVHPSWCWWWCSQQSWWCYFLPGLPSSRCPPCLGLLHSLLFCKAAFPAAILALQEVVPGAADGRGLPGGHEPCGSPPLYLQLVELCNATALSAGGVVTHNQHMTLSSANKSAPDVMFIQVLTCWLKHCYMFYRIVTEQICSGQNYLKILPEIFFYNLLNLLPYKQVVLFLLAAFFFSLPVPERFSPGRYDIVGHSHQLFHILLSLCTLSQQEALFHDFLWRRLTLARKLGEEHLLLACASFPCLVVCCAVTVLGMKRRAQARLIKEQR